MEGRCLVCGKDAKLFFCKAHNADKGRIHRFRQMEYEDQESMIKKKTYELSLLKKSFEYPQISITEVIKIARRV